VLFVGMEGQPTLKDFEVLKVGIFGVDIKFDSSHRNIKIDAVKDLAESSSEFEMVSKQQPGKEVEIGGVERTYTQFHIAPPW
jgi:hypothetical protein